MSDVATGLDLQAFADELISSTRDYIYIRPEDGLFIMRPNRLHHLNETACYILSRLYDPSTGPQVDTVVAETAQHYSVSEERVREDIVSLLRGVSALLNDDIMHAPSVTVQPFGTHHRELPVLSEVALTYRCQNRCTFCYADAPKRGDDVPEMTTDEVKIILDRIFDEAHCPTVSFTGGEPTLRRDLAELVAYGKAKGMRVNLITNGVRCADAAFVASLADAGLDSAQVSIEGGSAEIHDAITQHPGSFERSVQGVRQLRDAGIHTHTNTTICGSNRDHLLPLVDLLADELGSEYFSMNMVIRTGTALAHCEEDISYREIGPIIRAVQEHAGTKGIRFVWYSPVPYCMVNPVQLGLGGKSCACVDGLLSVNPAGQLIPCSSFDHGIGDLLHEPFEKVWYTRTARYWRNKEFIPPACQHCEIRDICCGACPLYWEERGNFDDLVGYAPGGAPWAEPVWRAKRWLWAGTQGVGLPGTRQRRRDDGQ